MAINVANFERQTTILQNTNQILDEITQGVGKTYRTLSFTSAGSYTFNVPLNVNKVIVTMGGGGGGGAISQPNGVQTYAAGETGGITSFGSYYSVSGGGGGYFTMNTFGVRSGKSGGSGGQPGSGTVLFSNVPIGGDGGNSGMFFGGKGIGSAAGFNGSETVDGGSCSGGAGAVLSTGSSASGGGGGDFVHGIEINVTPGEAITITVGAGGRGGYFESVTDKSGGKGGDGYVKIEWWE